MKDGDRWFKKPKYQLITLVLLLAVLGGVWAYVGTSDYDGSQSAVIFQPGIDWIEYIGGDSHASDIETGQFYLWEFHANDTVRQVRMLLRPNASGQNVTMGGPWLESYDDILSFSVINGSLINQTPQEKDNNGVMIYCYSYHITAADDQYGFDILTRAGYLHIRETDRFLSIGCNPQTYDAQYVHAIAIPQSADVTSIFDYQPYRHIVLDGWDIFYYDVTNISSHASIHITYVSGEDAPSLDWSEVEASR